MYKTTFVLIGLLFLGSVSIVKCYSYQRNKAFQVPLNRRRSEHAVSNGWSQLYARSFKSSDEADDESEEERRQVARRGGQSLPPHDVIVAKWYFEDEYSYVGDLPSGNDLLLYMNILIEIVAGDGIVSEPERQWIVGNAAVCGAPQAILEQINAYQPGSSNDIKSLSQDSSSSLIQQFRSSLFYDGFRAAAADNDLSAGEITAINNIAKQLGVTDEELQQLRALYEANEVVRQQKATVLFPNGVGTAVKVINEYT